MKKILSTSEILQELVRTPHPKELCATAEAEYDDTRSALVVRVDAFVREVHHAGPDVCIRPAWLPPSETLNEHVGMEEANDMAREIFRRWAKKVKAAAEVAHAFT